MNRKVDILAVMVALDTFSADDVVEALDMPKSSANSMLRAFETDKLIERVRVGHGFLYGVTSKGVAILSKYMPTIDPEERVLLLHVCSHENTSLREWIATNDIICKSVVCVDCETEVFASWRQNWFYGWEGASPEEHVTVDLLGRA